MKNKLSIVARAPASVANVGPGFDALGFAMTEPCVTVEVARGTEKGIRLESDVTLPADPRKNAAGAAAIALCSHLGIGEPLTIKITAGIPIGSGLGSSAASAVAAVVAANALLGSGLSHEKLLPFAVAGEAAVSGTPHADNVAPALFGGFTLVRSHEPVDWIAIPVPHDLHYVVVHPDCMVETAEARHRLPKIISLGEGVRQWAQVGTLVAGLCQGDWSMIARGLDDPLVEPIRGAMIPGYAAVKEAALRAGALGCSIAGSGPAMFGFVSSKKVAQAVGQAMQAAFRAAGVASRVWVGRVAAEGAYIVGPNC